MSTSGTGSPGGGFAGRLEAELVKVVGARASVAGSRETRRAPHGFPGRGLPARRHAAVRAGVLAAGAAAAVAAGFALGGLQHGLGPVGAGPVHVRTAAFTVDASTAGTVSVTWDKSQYIAASQDSAALQRALRAAGFPVLIREGVFCTGPHDSSTVDPSGEGPGVGRVMRGATRPDGSVVFSFIPSAMPRGEELFIGFLNQAQFAVTQGRPGSVERLVPASGPLACTPRLPFAASPVSPPPP